MKDIPYAEVKPRLHCNSQGHSGDRQTRYHGATNRHGHDSIISLQVANDGYNAFNKAHTNMDKIRLQTLETPKSLKNALTILFKVQ